MFLPNKNIFRQALSYNFGVTGVWLGITNDPGFGQPLHYVDNGEPADLDYFAGGTCGSPTSDNIKGGTYILGSGAEGGMCMAQSITENIKSVGICVISNKNGEYVYTNFLINKIDLCKAYVSFLVKRNSNP